MALSKSDITSASSMISFSLRPRWVTQGVPRRMPDGSKADLSPGMVLRLTTIPAISRMRAAWSPERVTPSRPRTLEQSTLVRWVLVPPYGMRKPCSCIRLVKTAQFLTICFCSARNCSVWANLNVVAIEANTCTCGPPCSPGKTARSILRARAASVVRIQAPRGPHKDLCVVNVITSA